MEPINILKFWRTSTNATETTIGATDHRKNFDGYDGYDHDDDEGSFFDLEFNDNDGGKREQKIETSYSGEDEGDTDSAATDDCERDYDFRCRKFDHNLSLSPSDDLFFKGRFLQFEQSPSSSSPSSSSSSEPNNSKHNHQLNVSLFRSATKFRVFMFGLKRTKSEKFEEINGGSPTILKQKSQRQTKFEILHKIKVEELPIMSLFSRENSLRLRNSSVKQSSSTPSEDQISSESKNLGKEVVQKYLKLIKPILVRVSKRSGSKSRFSRPLNSEFEEKEEILLSSTSKTLKSGNLPSGLRVVCKHLGKSRSASSSSLGSISIPTIQRKNLQEEDGIQSAILYCKKSFNNSSRDSTLLSRSVSDPSHEKSISYFRNTSIFIKEEQVSL